MGLESQKTRISVILACLHGMSDFEPTIFPIDLKIGTLT
jgi:hypothetical protein